MDAKIRTPLARCALAAAALVGATAIAPASASAGGPGVTVFTRESPQPLTLSGDEIASSGDVRGRTYTVRRSPGGAGTRLRLTGLSIRSLLLRAGADPDRVRFVSVVRANGSLAVLNRADLRDPPPFPEGPALVADDGSTTHFLRPVRGRRGTNAADHVVTSNAGPLEITVNGGSLLAVSASASRRRVKPGKSVTFSARVRFPPPGARITYHWDFGDGTTATGQRVTHSFAIEADQQVQVSARATGGSSSACSTICGGVDTVAVRVGNPRRGPQAPGGSAGSGAGNPQAPGSGTGTGAGGVGGSGGGNTPGATGEAEVQAVLRRLQQQRERQRAREQAAVRRRREAARRRAAAARRPARVAPERASEPFGPVVTGVLLAGQGTTFAGRLPSRAAAQPAGSPRAQQAARGAPQADGAPLPLTAGLALLVASMGALQERRRVRLRIA